MKKQIIGLFVVMSLIAAPAISFAGDSAADLIREGLLGAGSGALGGAVSGGKTENLWISALTGAGVNIVGGSLLDIITEENNVNFLP